MTASPVSSLLLIGVGGAGVRVVRRVRRAYGGGLLYSRRRQPDRGDDI